MPASKRFIELTETMRDIHKRKNAGYAGDSTDPWENFRMAELFGISAFDGCLIRLSDKFKRIANLVKNPNNEQVGEAITDTLIDLANYAIIAICLYEDEQEKRKENIDAGNRSNTAEAGNTTAARPVYPQEGIVKDRHEDTEAKVFPEWREAMGRSG